MFKKVLLSEDIDTISQGVMSIMEKLNINHVHQVQYCDDAYLRVLKSDHENKLFELVITDLSFKSDHRKQNLESGEALIKKLRESFPMIKIIAYSVEDRIEKVRYLLNELKVDAYVSKGRNGLSELEEAIVRVYNGETYVSPELARNLTAKRPIEILDSDLQILSLLSTGYSQDQISEQLKNSNIKPNSLSSIEKRLNILKGHFRANNSTHLIAITKDMGLI